MTERGRAFFSLKEGHNELVAAVFRQAAAWGKQGGEIKVQSIPGGDIAQLLVLISKSQISDLRVLNAIVCLGHRNLLLIPSLVI
jgi:hypothetical protein